MSHAPRPCSVSPTTSPENGRLPVQVSRLPGGTTSTWALNISERRPASGAVPATAAGPAAHQAPRLGPLDLDAGEVGPRSQVGQGQLPVVHLETELGQLRCKPGLDVVLLRRTAHARTADELGQPGHELVRQVVDRCDDVVSIGHALKLDGA